MNTILIISSNEKDKNLLSEIFRNLGAEAVFSQTLNDALAIFEKTRPKAVFICDEENASTNVKIREILRIAPFMPIIVLLKERDASKAVAYMRMGAFDCGQPPWTEESIAPLYKKSLNISGTALDLSKPVSAKERILIYFFVVSISLFAGFMIGRHYVLRDMEKRRMPDLIELPYSHPSGITFDKKGILISDWFTQSIYSHNISDFKISKVVNFPDITPASIAAAESNLWILTAGGAAEKRLLDKKFTPVSKTKTANRNMAGICFDGLYFWTADFKNNLIKKHYNNDELTELETHKYPGKAIAAFTCDSRFLWIVDENLKELVKFPLDSPGTPVSKKEIKEYASRTLRITAIASKDGTIWLAGEDREKGVLFRHNAE